MVVFSCEIKWLPPESGGRKSPPPIGRYFSVSKFEEDKDWNEQAWSVAFEIESFDSKKMTSFGKVRFLVEGAPHDRMKKNREFEIYEGPKKVGDVSLLDELNIDF